MRYWQYIPPMSIGDHDIEETVCDIDTLEDIRKVKHLYRTIKEDTPLKTVQINKWIYVKQDDITLGAIEAEGESK